VYVLMVDDIVHHHKTPKPKHICINLAQCA
jgi:hypothetical protein